MLLSYSRPRNIAWAIRNNAGPLTFLTSAAALTNGRPGSVTRFTWPTGPYVQIEATWAEPSMVGLFGLIGTTLPAGMKLEIAYRIAGTPNFAQSPALGVVIERPMGERVAWIRATPGDEGFDGMRLRISNSLDIGFPTVVAGTAVDLGEIWLGEAQELDVNSDWNQQYEDPTATTETELMQPYSQRGTVRRVVTFTPSAYEQETRDANPDGFPLIERILAKTNRGQQAVVAPRYQAPDEYMLAVTATFGTLSKGGYRHVDGAQYEHEQMTMREAGIPVRLDA